MDREIDLVCTVVDGLNIWKWDEEGFDPIADPYAAEEQSEDVECYQKA
jgi:hypothetical protein